MGGLCSGVRIKVRAGGMDKTGLIHLRMPRKRSNDLR
jgi:hypothetical protein